MISESTSELSFTLFFKFGVMLYILKGNENKTKPMGENNLKNIPSVLFLRAWANVKPKIEIKLDRKRI